MLRSLAFATFVLVPALTSVVHAQDASTRAPASGSWSLVAPQASAHSLSWVAQSAPAERRGRMGVELEAAEHGAVRVARVLEGSAAERAGLAAGDLLLSFEGRELNGASDLIERVGSRSPRTEVQLRLRRSVELELDERRRTEDGRLALGVMLGADDALVVARVVDGFAAQSAGLAAGDRIVSVAGRELDGYDALVELMRDAKADRALSLTFERDVRVRLDEAPGGPAVQPRATPAPRIERAPRVRPAPRVQPTPRVELAPPPQPRLWGAPRVEGRSSDLAEELRALTEDLRALREELALLRAELASQRRAGAGRAR